MPVTRPRDSQWMSPTGRQGDSCGQRGGFPGTLAREKGDKPIWEQIGSSFIQHYYQLFDNDRTQLGAIYIDASCLTWEGQQFQGKAAIVELSSLPFQKIQHSITAQDYQPTPDSCIISMVVGQLKADEDPIMGFHQMFLLKNISDAWVCTNDMFRLALHNFG
ncbi:nuclear transport factor 2-like [Aotus nancymaae]|uniref:nuclear transport factor 2-like n=1 Tax=Aotus nancymaae TaxID=37293 RepID=UPI0030FED7DD